MSNAFTNFLGNVAQGIFGDQPGLKDFQHANRLYVRNNYARAPKVGFLYYVVLNINNEAILSPTWKHKEVGLLAKKTDLPKFSIETEVLNQYNRKTVIQKSLKYNSINIEFHDDNSDISRDLWVNYFKYYYADSNYGGNSIQTKLPAGIPPQFTDTKFNTNYYRYGYNNSLKKLNGTGQTAEFFQSIDIYVLHQHRFSQYTLVNPKITDWTHDSVDQSEGSKILSNKMSLVYETVLYNEGTVKLDNPPGFATVHYDTSPSPLSLGGNGTNTIFGPGGVLAGASAIFGEDGLLNKENKTPLDYLNIALQGNNLRKNVGSLTKEGLKTEGYSILSGVLGNIQAQGNQPGGVSEAVRAGLNQQGVTSQGRLGINLFSGQNSSVNNNTQARPSGITGY